MKYNVSLYNFDGYYSHNASGISNTGYVYNSDSSHPVAQVFQAFHDLSCYSDNDIIDFTTL